MKHSSRVANKMLDVWLDCGHNDAVSDVQHYELKCFVFMQFYLFIFLAYKACRCWRYA